MKRFLSWIKKKLFVSKKPIFASEVLSGVGELSNISASLFIHAELAKSLQRDVIILIVSNDFTAEPGMILTHFKRNYNFSIDEFVVLSYKVGMVVKMYVENPVNLLTDAIKLTDVFAQETILQFEQLLKNQILHDDNILKCDCDEFYIKLDKEKKEFKLKAEDIDANRQIDEWLKKNKKD